MTNLSDLFPAGAGKQVSFTASGNVTSSGKPVVLNSDGTVSEVSGTASSVGSPDQFTPTTAYGGGGPQSVCYDTTNDAFVIAFKNAGDSNGLYVIAATLSGTNFTYGSAAAVAYPANADTYDIVFDSLRNCFVVVYQDNSNLKCMTGTVSGTTITMNSSSALVVSSATYGLVKAVFDSTNNKTLLFCRDSSSKGQCFAISVDVSYAPSTSAAYNFSGTDNVDNSFIALRGVHDPDQGVVLLSYRGPSVVGYLSLVDCSGATPTGTLLTNSAWSSSGFGGGDIGYDTVNNKCVITVYDSDNSNYLSYQVVTIDSSSTATFGTKVTQSAANSQWPDMQYTDYDPTAAATVCCYTSNNLGTYAQKATVSGTTLTIDSTLLEIVNSTLIAKQQGVVYDPDTSQFVIAYYNYDATDEGYAKAYKVATSNLTATNFLGISDAAISSAASGNITIKGGIAATGLSSLTPASDYYVQNDGTITTVSSNVKAGKALSATAINLEYTS
jgi:hypothetical protein